METITYNLNAVKGSSFYDQLSDFTTIFLNSRSDHSKQIVFDFQAFHVKQNSGQVRSFDEYYLEYITMGLLLDKYAVNAMSSGVLSIKILKFLYKNRNRFSHLKPTIDKLRGWLSSLFLKNSLFKIPVNSTGKFKHFLNWLDATGEFSEEVIRLNYWHMYLKTLDTSKHQELLNNSINEAKHFEEKAGIAFRDYTSNVETFRKKQLQEHKFKENYIFCGRHESEYHLNMVGAEILNRALKKQYDNTTKKVILFPTCMSNPAGEGCKAIKKGSKLICTGCSPECSINIKRWEYTTHNTEVVLIPHSSEFTRYLKYWKNQETTGLIGVACVLNLLKGGYEMQKLNIPSQCVFLDYCGCQKHWHKNGIPTDLNTRQLQKIVG